MPPPISHEELRLGLMVYTEPLQGLSEDANEFKVGFLSFPKNRPSFRSGFGYGLHPDAHFVKEPFDLDGRRGIALMFASYGEPAWYMAGWVEPYREAELDTWCAFLNAEIARRHRGEPAQPIPRTIKPAQPVPKTSEPRMAIQIEWPAAGKESQDAEDEAERRRFENSLRVKPFRPDKG